eukprot:gene12771-10237_t
MADGGGGGGRAAQMMELRQRRREQARGRAAPATWPAIAVRESGARGQPRVAQAKRARLDSLSGAKLFNAINAG